MHAWRSWSPRRRVKPMQPSRDHAEKLSPPSNDNLRGDPEAAASFLQKYHRLVGGFPVLSASHVDRGTGAKGKFETKSFPEPTDWPAVQRWIAERDGNNIYFSVNPLIKAQDRKAEKSDIASMVAFHVDIDAR